MRFTLPAFSVLLFACAPAGLPQGDAASSAPDPSRTIERAPPIPFDAALPPPDRRPGTEAEWYAREHGVGLDEARRRMRLQQETAEQIGVLQERLAREEAGNFAGLWIEHEPAWRVVVAFTRDPEATLRRYERNPLFTARPAQHALSDLEAASERAIVQLRRTGLPFGGGVDIRENVVIFEVGAEQAEVDALLASGRVAASPMLRLRGLPPILPREPVAPEAARFVRIFPQQRHRNIAETSELNVGRIVLRDGCLRLEREGEDPIAFFGAEAGLRISEAGRLAVYNRVTGQSGHVGERMVLGGGAGREIADTAIVAPIHAACGPGPVVYVGNPHSYAAFRMAHVAHRVDARAAAEGISREEAFRRIRDEWAAEDARFR